MRDVLELYSQAVTDREGNVHLASVHSMNPPALLWAGLQVYARFMRRNISDIQAAEAEKAKAQRR